MSAYPRATWGWPALLVLFKPTLVPLTLIGIRDRSWWVALAIIAGVSLMMLPLWLQYVTAMANIRGLDGLTYSLGSGPLLLIPVVAWFTHYWRKTREPDQIPKP